MSKFGEQRSFVRIDVKVALSDFDIHLLKLAAGASIVWLAILYTSKATNKMYRILVN